MFQSTRLKLTAWYLCIIMLISIVFSVTIYRIVDSEIQRYVHRIEHQRHDPFDSPPPLVTIQDLQESDQRLLITLLGINIGILVLSGAAGYFLAGRTLRPIKDMMDEQNRFITDASHELRTPLTSLKSEIEVYMRGNHHTANEADTLLKSNLEEVNNLQVLSDNLIQLAQSQKPNGNHIFTDVSLVTVIQTAAKKLNIAAKQKSITIESEIKDYSLYGDKESLIQLFSILLDNAIKYSPLKSKIKTTAKNIDHTVLITVVDQGIGIEKKDIPHIFDRFYRADTSRTKQVTSGYGLGLSIAKKIVNMHNGIITVKSEPGKGTTFTIHLPSKQGDA